MFDLNPHGDFSQGQIIFVRQRRELSPLTGILFVYKDIERCGVKLYVQVHVCICHTIFFHLANFISETFLLVSLILATVLVHTLLTSIQLLFLFSFNLP